MAVLARTTLLFSKAAEKSDASFSDTFPPLGGALHSSGCLRGACSSSSSSLRPPNQGQAAR